ncbi:MAG TPA: DUF6600 domain-containing protein [Thiobacillaceae bacterium]|nr:DUF6600 domain-containing protein [Thiobacillaceae bacterium]
MEHLLRILFIPFLLLLLLPGAAAQADDDETWAPTPPRLSFIDGEVSYWRPGAEDWVSARPNLPLAGGDALYTGQNANFEVQFDSRSFVRADDNTQLSLVNQEEHFIQFKLTDGLVSFDIGSIAEGDTVEVDTPNAVFTIEHPGYYRVDVDAQDTHFITQHGGRATVTTSDGRSMSIYPSEDIVITGDNPPQVATYAAPAPDAWDRWNDERTSRITESVSSRYLPPDVYGADELDTDGQWRIMPEFGPVWIPYGVGADWVPYSTGTWIWDPYYEWTWVDDAPWGWAPFHYGRWVDIGGLWAWAPGPVVRRSAYCPALVSFLARGHDGSLRAGTSAPRLAWVPLSWGEPVLPWWGRREFRDRPHWVGWGGPRIVNNVVVNRTTVINVNNIHYRNASLPRAILTVPGDKFGRTRFHATPVTDVHHEDFSPVHGELPIKPSRLSLSGGAPTGLHPPREIVTRQVVASHPPRERALPWQNEEGRPKPTQVGPAPHIVKPPSLRDRQASTPPRPPFGPQAGPERRPLPLPPRFGEVRTAPAPTPSPQSTGIPAFNRKSDNMRRTEPLPVHPVPPPAQPVPGFAHPAPGSAPSAVPPGGSRATPAGQQDQLERRRFFTPPLRQEGGQAGNVRSLPGTPANQTYQRPAGEVRRWGRDQGRDNQ